MQWGDLGRLLPDGRDVRLALLREHIELDFEPVPLEGNMAQIQARANEADDRFLMARAYLATRAGRFDEAKTELEACLQHRLDDPVIWRAWLDWAVAVGQSGPVREAMSHLAAGSVDAVRVQTLRAWLAARRHDPSAERRALAQLVTLDPSDPPALARLAELTHQAGDTQAAARLRLHKAELDADRERYFRLFKQDRFVDHLVELARLAERLGRRFEARGFWELVLQQNTANVEARPALARLAPADHLRGETTVTLAGLLASDLGPTPAPTRRARPARRARPVRSPFSPTRPGPRGWIRSSLITAARRSTSFPRWPAAALACSTTTATAGSTSTPSREAPFLPVRPGMFQATVSSATGVTVRSRTSRRRPGSPPCPAATATPWRSATIDNDGDPDLFITRWRSYALYRNRGDGTFEDGTARVGLDGDRDWPTSAAFADLDGDGDLDLYVCHYGVWDPEHPKLCKDPSGNHYLLCDPRAIEPLPDHVFRNDGGRFVDVTAESGMAEHEGRGLGVLAADLDDDGRIDLFVANDTTANYLFHNQGGFRFEEIGTVAGVAANAAGGYQAGMGIACGDLDGDGRLDLAVTNFYLESTSFFQNLGQNAFADRTAAIGLAAASRNRLGFGIGFLDADNDGRLDLMTANGHISDLRPLIPLAMAAQLFVGSGGGRLTDVSERAGPPFEQLHVGRGLAIGDLDNDGRLDALMVAHNEPLVEFHNQTEPRNHFVTFRVEGTKSNRDGVGTRLTITAGGRRQVAERVGGGSYASASDPSLHFGLGSSPNVESVEVRWPSGRCDRYENLAADTGYLLREGDLRARRLAGFSTTAKTGPRS